MVVEEGKEEEEEKKRRRKERKKRKEEKEEEERKRRREKKEEERKTTSMRLDPDLVRKAHDLGLNVTKVCENALKEAIRRMEGAGCENATSGGRSERQVVRPPGIEPGSSAREADVLPG